MYVTGDTAFSPEYARHKRNKQNSFFFNVKKKNRGELPLHTTASRPQRTRLSPHMSHSPNPVIGGHVTCGSAAISSLGNGNGNDVHLRRGTVHVHAACTF